MKLDEEHLEELEVDKVFAEKTLAEPKENQDKKGKYRVQSYDSEQVPDFLYGAGCTEREVNNDEMRDEQDQQAQLPDGQAMFGRAWAGDRSIGMKLDEENLEELEVGKGFAETWAELKEIQDKKGKYRVQSHDSQSETKMGTGARWSWL